MSPNIKLATMFIVALGAIGTAATAFAQQPEDADCWGAVTSKDATTSEGNEFGQHAADPLPEVEGRETPRVGLPNVLDSLEGPLETPRDPDHPSELGEALDGTIDEGICP